MIKCIQMVTQYPPGSCTVADCYIVLISEKCAARRAGPARRPSRPGPARPAEVGGPVGPARAAPWSTHSTTFTFIIR